MKKTLLYVALVIFMSSCIKDIEETIDNVSNINKIRWNPTIAVPLIYSRLGVKDVMDEVEDFEFIRVENDGSLTLIYSDFYESKEAQDVIQLPDYSFSNTLTLTPAQLATLNSTGTLSFTLNPKVNIAFDGNEIDKVWYKKGNLNLAVSSTLEHDIRTELNVAEAKKNGASLKGTVTALDNASLLTTGSISVPLADVESDYTKTAAGHSEQELELIVTVTKKGSNSIKPIEEIDFSIEYVEQEYSQLTGLFVGSDFSVSSQGNLNLSIFANSNNGSFTLADPRINIILTNSIGIGVDARITQFDGENTDGNIISLSGIPDPVPIPQLSFLEIGQSKMDSFALNKSTSNLADYINNRPAKNEYAFSVMTTNSGSDRHWILDTSKVGAKVKVEVPLAGTAKKFIIENSQELTMNLEDADEIDEVLIRLYTENGFPMDVATQIYFEDSSTNSVLDSLITSDILILPSAALDGNGKVTTPNPNTTDILISKDRISMLEQANRIRIKAYFNTPFDSNGSTQPDVKFYEEYNVLLQLGIQATATITQ